MELQLRILISIVMVVASFAHSGLYAVNTTKVAKDFSAAWLVSKSRFIASEPSLSKAVSMASATFCLIRNRCENCKTLASRDFMDFMVEHLSAATNQLPIADNELFGLTINRIEQTAEALKQSTSVERDSRLDKTIGILVYSSICFSKVTEKIQSTVRPAFFTATFWSVHRYIKNIVIYVANEKDKEIVDSMNLPYLVLTQLETPLDSKNRTSLLPRDSMLDLLNNLKTDSSYSQYEYVFFSEGDQILHLREPEVMYDTIDNSGGTFITVPHRMQSLTLAHDFPEDVRHKWPKNHAQNIPGMPVALGSIEGDRGSCCQSGDVEVAPCFGWWYQCPDYGIRDFKTWLKFGDTGLTMPPVTEHKATCEYFPERRQCPIPANCASAVPRIASGKTVLDEKDVCTEIVETRYLGYGPPPASTQQVSHHEASTKADELVKVVRKTVRSNVQEPARPETRTKPDDRVEQIVKVVSETQPKSVEMVPTVQVEQQHSLLRRQPIVPLDADRGIATATSDMGDVGLSNADYEDSGSAKMRRKNRMRRRNRRIESVTYTSNEKRAKREGTLAAGVTKMDDIQLS